MALSQQDYPTGTLRLNLEQRTVGDSGGPAIRVYGPTTAGKSDWQLLRFDCFKVEPHYHYNPDGPDEHISLEGASAEDSVGWSLTQLRTNLPEMLRHAGATEEAIAAGTSPEVRAAIEKIATALGRA